MLLFTLLFAVLGSIDILIQKRVVMPSFAELERNDSQASMKRIGNALNRTLESLEFHAADWGNWYDAYQFMQAPNTAFEGANFTAYAMKRIQVNSISMIDMQGHIVYSVARDLQSGVPMGVDLLDRKSLPNDFPWRDKLTSGEAARGFVGTNQGVMMIAAAPILNGSGAGRPLGMILMGRLLTSDQVRMVAAQAEADFDMTPMAADGVRNRIVQTEAVTRAYHLVDDVYGKPVMQLRVDVPRRITERGYAAVTYASAYLIGAAVVGLFLLVVVLTKVVLDPLARLTRHAIEVGERSDLSQQLNLPGNDEVSLLAREFDRMVVRVADSRSQLVDQSFQSGFAELAKGVMHNLGNAMTPLGVRLSKLDKRLSTVPVDDMQRAASELAGDSVDVARRADLENFLRLGCHEIGAMLNESRNDVAVIQRQSDLVRTSLNDLMRSTRNDYLVEAVRLPELVTQTLEIVPDTCRQRLTIDTDESLHKVGVIQVARTVLRLILQNLIINAADAVRDAGRQSGRLHVAAEILHEQNRRQLHLCCKDDGIGIGTDQLTKVFEKGFSTKSRDSNYGIGLHWCSNTLRALGGRIWATSDGPGLGASMHLVIPLGMRAANLGGFEI
jgi:sensor domain CHASE-containing protein